MITAEIIDMSVVSNAEEVESFYNDFLDESLVCDPHACMVPPRSYLRSPGKIVIAARDDRGGLVGVCVVKEDMVYYPMMIEDDRQDILKALILKGHEANGGYLKAYTANELILTMAVDMGVGVVRNGNWLEFR